MTSFSKYTRALTFENFCQAGAAESKPPGMGLLKQQMRHLDVLRQRLAKLAVQTGGRLSRLTSGRARPLPPPSSLESSLLGHLSVLRRRLDRLSGREAGEDRGGGGKDRGGERSRGFVAATQRPRNGYMLRERLYEGAVQS